MGNPKISVAMATYNGERFLQEQLDSIARQTLLPHELVVCDDGSTDGTLDILHRFAAHAPFPVRIYQNETRLGYRDNFLRAVELCEGDLVAFSDQDDVWLPEKLAACARRFTSQSVSMVIHLAMLTDANLRPIGRVWPDLGLVRRRCPGNPSLLYMDTVGMTMLFRKEAARPLTESLLLRHDLSRVFSGHDHVIRFLAAASGHIVPLRRVLALHRRHGANTSNAHSAVAFSGSSYVRGAWGVRGKLLAATDWLTTHARLAMLADWGSYAREAQHAKATAVVLRNAASLTDGRLHSMLEKSSAALSRRANALSARSALYRESTARAVMHFCHMVLHGCYLPRRLGGLGFWSLAKDSLVVFRIPRQRGYDVVRTR